MYTYQTKEFNERSQYSLSLRRYILEVPRVYSELGILIPLLAVLLLKCTGIFLLKSHYCYVPSAMQLPEYSIAVTCSYYVHTYYRLYIQIYNVPYIVLVYA
ncbi:uncharacterized protein B0T23DRAFT_399259 [Neurospora hispaniola]|uniref:Uncharacterized protein n=1 Tax=Neurospora hispaniola TaxID=588809 RepID=A0AAJ0I1D8_9PEZI|nr:hypothetical protein B0T23DRAFT_399259 [Neurospora hispaniola]